MNRVKILILEPDRAIKLSGSDLRDIQETAGRELIAVIARTIDEAKMIFPKHVDASIIVISDDRYDSERHIDAGLKKFITMIRRVFRNPPIMILAATCEERFTAFLNARCHSVTARCSLPRAILTMVQRLN